MEDYIYSITFIVVIGWFALFYRGFLFELKLILGLGVRDFSLVEFVFETLIIKIFYINYYNNLFYF